MGALGLVFIAGLPLVADAKVLFDSAESAALYYDSLAFLGIHVEEPPVAVESPHGSWMVPIQSAIGVEARNFDRAGAVWKPAQAVLDTIAEPDRSATFAYGPDDELYQGWGEYRMEDTYFWRKESRQLVLLNAGTWITSHEDGRRTQRATLHGAYHVAANFFPERYLPSPEAKRALSRKDPVHVEMMQIFDNLVRIRYGVTKLVAVRRPTADDIARDKRKSLDPNRLYKLPYGRPLSNDSSKESHPDWSTSVRPAYVKPSERIIRLEPWQFGVSGWRHDSLLKSPRWPVPVRSNGWPDGWPDAPDPSSPARRKR